MNYKKKCWTIVIVNIKMKYALYKTISSKTWAVVLYNLKPLLLSISLIGTLWIEKSRVFMRFQSFPSSPTPERVIIWCGRISITIHFGHNCSMGPLRQIFLPFYLFYKHTFSKFYNYVAYKIQFFHGFTIICISYDIQS